MTTNLFSPQSIAEKIESRFAPPDAQNDENPRDIAWRAIVKSASGHDKKLTSDEKEHVKSKIEELLAGADDADRRATVAAIRFWFMTYDQFSWLIALDLLTSEAMTERVGSLVKTNNKFPRRDDMSVENCIANAASAAIGVACKFLSRLS